MIGVFAILVLGIIYSLLLVYYYRAWQAQPHFFSNQNAVIRFSIIIPARNEEKNIVGLLAAIQNQNYPADAFEVIVVDDHSTDQTVAEVSHFDFVKLIRLSGAEENSQKKKAIRKGIEEATGDWIITTDADCIPPLNWLQTLANFIAEKNPVLVVAPVKIICQEKSMLQIFQAMDFMMLQGITGASVYKKMHSLSNGANLAYLRSAFWEVNAFEGIDQIASGDDLLLMQKIAAKYPNQIHYLKSKEAIVETAAVNSWKDFFQQRIRWASKATVYKEKNIFWVLLTVYLFNLGLFILFVYGFFNFYAWIVLVLLLFLKTICEIPFYFSLSRFFDNTWTRNYFILFQPMHILYTIIAGLFGQLGSYEWKGRKVK